MRNLEEYNGALKGQPVFIVASGPSLYFQDLLLIEDRVTIAVNSGFLAVPDCNFFISDDHSVANWSYFFRDLREAKTEVLLYEDKLKHVASLFGQRSVLYRHRTGYHVTDVYSHDDPTRRIIQCRSSVGSAIHVAHIMGCSPIVLLGVDGRRLSGNRYFWQFDRKRFGNPHRSDGFKTDGFKRVKNNGFESDEDLKSISDYWNSFGKQLLEKCEIYNASSFSNIQVFPKMRFEDAVNL